MANTMKLLDILESMSSKDQQFILNIPKMDPNSVNITPEKYLELLSNLCLLAIPSPSACLH